MKENRIQNSSTSVSKAASRKRAGKRKIMRPRAGFGGIQNNTLAPSNNTDLQVIHLAEDDQGPLPTQEAHPPIVIVLPDERVGGGKRGAGGQPEVVLSVPEPENVVRRVDKLSSSARKRKRMRCPGIDLSMILVNLGVYVVLFNLVALVVALSLQNYEQQLGCKFSYKNQAKKFNQKKQFFP